MLIQQDDEISSFKFMEYLKLVKKALENENGIEKVLNKESVIFLNYDQKTE